MQQDDGRQTTLDVLIQTVQAIRADSYPQIPANVVARIVDIEVDNEENPERAVPRIEEEISKAARGKMGVKPRENA